MRMVGSGVAITDTRFWFKHMKAKTDNGTKRLKIYGGN